MKTHKMDVINIMVSEHSINIPELPVYHCKVLLVSQQSYLYTKMGHNICLAPVEPREIHDNHFNHYHSDQKILIQMILTLKSM